MANLKDSCKFSTHDDYYTPKSAWEQVSHLIPENIVIWEACCLNSHKSQSPEYLQELNPTTTVVADRTMNCLTQKPENFDMIITNPPFSNKKKDGYLKSKVLTRLHDLDKPFMIIMNSMNTFTKYLRTIFKGDMKYLQIITPQRKIQFNKLLKSGELVPTKKCSFYCIYLCYKMDLPTESLWLN
tara:strand:+ start:1956 stop:2507 length:552 start_codon:yes stop_codon:yes gene_type:complete